MRKNEQSGVRNRRASEDSSSQAQRRVRLSSDTKANGSSNARAQAETERSNANARHSPGANTLGTWVKESPVPFFRRIFVTGSFDVTFFILLVILLGIGLVMLYSASYTYAFYNKRGDSAFFFRQQAIFMAVGFVAMLIISKINYRALNGWATILISAISLFLLVLVLVVNLIKGGDDDEFRRWLDLGIRFQPSEIAKFALVLLLSFLIARKYNLLHSNHIEKSRRERRNESNFLRALFHKPGSTGVVTIELILVIGVFAGLIVLEKHLSCTVLILMLGYSMLWLGGVNKKLLIVFAVIAVLGAIYVIFVNRELIDKYAGERITAWLDKEYSPGDKRWQVNQSLYAIASGGPFGLGFTKSRQKHLYVSEPQNDFIFAIVCEELGFVGATVIILLFALLVWRGFVIASKTRDLFGSLLCMGLVLQVGIQVALNIMVVTDTIPNTGIGLPFFSYGGTSLLMLMGEMGIVLGISRQSTIEKFTLNGGNASPGRQVTANQDKRRS